MEARAPLPAESTPIRASTRAYGPNAYTISPKESRASPAATSRHPSAQPELPSVPIQLASTAAPGQTSKDVVTAVTDPLLSSNTSSMTSTPGRSADASLEGLIRQIFPSPAPVPATTVSSEPSGVENTSSATASSNESGLPVKTPSPIALKPVTHAEPNTPKFSLTRQSSKRFSSANTPATPNSEELDIARNGRNSRSCSHSRSHSRSHNSTHVQTHVVQNATGATPQTPQISETGQTIQNTQNTQTPVRTRSHGHTHTSHSSHGSHSSHSSSHHHSSQPGSAPQKRTSIGPWDFVKSIGAGSMGQVKLAVHRYTRQPAAVKVVPKAFMQRYRNGDGATNGNDRESEEAKDARIIREAALGRLVDHPNIAKLYGVYSMTGHYYLVFEYIAGGQMLDYIITHGCVKEQQARRFARSIASALDYLHRNSIVHRDLKIENILIADDGDIRLIDFGLSNLFSRSNLLKTFCGSLYFAAPELLNALPYVGPEIDVWSFGVVLYVLVCGKVPFEDKSMTVLHAKIKRGVVEYPSWLSSLCTDLLSRMLVVSPSERATLHEVIHHPWMLKNFDSPVSAYMPSRVPLSMPLDHLVLKEIADLRIGEEDALGKDLEHILQSVEYCEAVSAWASRGSSSSMTLPLRTPDPLDSYHPAISMYFLAKERLERLAAPDTPAGSLSRVQSIKNVTGATENGQSNDAIVPARTRARARARTVGNYEASQASSRVPALPIQASTVSPAKPGEITSNGIENSGVSSPSAAGHGYGHGHVTSNTPHSPSIRVVSAPQAPQFGPSGQSPPQPASPQSMLPSNNPNLGSIFRKLSLRKPSKAKHARAKSVGHPTEAFDEVELGNSAASASNSTATTIIGSPLSGQAAPSASTQSNHSGLTMSPEDRMPSIANPKPVFLRGFFSVQSTSNKPLVAIRSEIIRVLDKMTIEYVEIRGGFSCVSRPVPSPISSVGTNGPSSRSVSRQASRSHRRSRSSASSHFMPMSPMSPGAASPGPNTTFGSTDSVEMEIGGSDMLGNGVSGVGRMPTPVRFEIMIVRVPIMNLHGIQFKKMTGNVWQYKTLAQDILNELHF